MVWKLFTCDAQRQDRVESAVSEISSLFNIQHELVSAFIRHYRLNIRFFFSTASFNFFLVHDSE